MSDKKLNNLVIFFTAYLLSAFGYEFIFFIMTVHVYDLSKSALNVSIFTALTFIPKLFSSVMGGTADKFGRTRCFAFSSVAVSALVLIMTAMESINGIYITWFFISIFLTFIINVRSSLMAEIVSKERYVAGNAVVLSLLNGAKLLGPLLGGFIVTYYTIRPLMYFICSVYLLAAFSASNIRVAREAAVNRGGLIDNARNGFRFMVQNRTFGFLTSVAFFWRLFLGLQLSLFVIYIKTHLEGTSSQYGVFLAVMGIGSIIGSLTAPYAAKRFGIIQRVTVGLSLHYASFIAFGFCNSYYWALAIIFISYMLFYMTVVGMHSIRDRVTRTEIRGSAYGAVTAVLTPAAIISMLAGGYLTNRFDVTIVLAGAGIIALVSYYILLLLPGKRGKALLETYRESEAAAAV